MTARKKWLFIALSFALCTTLAHAEILTATFTGLADGYENHGPNDPGTYFNDNFTSGSLIFDPAQFSFNGNFYEGPGVQLTFHLRGHTETWGGIGLDPALTPDGGFFAGSDPDGQGVRLKASNCPCFSATFDIVGPPDAFGLATLTPDSFHPGPVFLDRSFAEFGDRDLGAHIRFTSISMTQGSRTVVSSVPEPSVAASLLAGFALLGVAAQRLRRSHLLDGGQTSKT